MISIYKSLNVQETSPNQFADIKLNSAYSMLSYSLEKVIKNRIIALFFITVSFFPHITELHSIKKSKLHFLVTRPSHPKYVKVQVLSRKSSDVFVKTLWCVGVQIFSSGQHLLKCQEPDDGSAITAD